LYGDQNANVDNSAGARIHKPQVHYFWDILTKVDATSLDKVVTVQANSMELEPTQLMSLMTHNPRFVSVDGAHFGMAAFFDLNLAARIIHPEGVIAMDDYRNVGWPGVAAAFMTFEAVFPAELRPFLATDMKLYLCKVESHGAYLAAAKRRFANAKVCSVDAIPYQPDTRVELDKATLGSFVDITGSRGTGDFCAFGPQE